MLSGVVSYIAMLFVGLALIGALGNTSQYNVFLGVLLIAMFAWWVLRRVGIVPAY